MACPKINCESRDVSLILPIFDVDSTRKQTGSLLHSFDDDDDDWGPIILQWYTFLVRVGINHKKYFA